MRQSLRRILGVALLGLGIQQAQQPIPVQLADPGSGISGT